MLVLVLPGRETVEELHLSIFIRINSAGAIALNLKKFNKSFNNFNMDG